jgi:DNA-binding LytR/AlgR family response regulator
MFHMPEPFFIRTEVKKERVLKKVDPMQVTRLSTVKNYTKIFLTDDTFYPVRTSLVNALKNFPPNMFVKIDRADVVSVFHIDEIAKDHLMLKGKSVRIARSYYKYVVAGINIMEEER